MGKEYEYIEEDRKLLEGLKSLPGQLIVIERGDFVGLREAIGRDLGMENTNTLAFYVDGRHLGTATEEQPEASVMRKALMVLKVSEHPVRAISIGGNEDVEIGREEFQDLCKALKK